jgi:hypothetical protein
MKVLNLRCANGHGFEGWFGSEDDYLSQSDRGLVACPLCADTGITRLPSAPRLNLSSAREPVAQPVSASPPVTVPSDIELQATWLRAVRHVMANTEDVGERFADEARRIHHGEAQPRGIRGQASRDEAIALVEEGIEVAMLPVPKALKEPLQ